jgi:hypothetical protein
MLSLSEEFLQKYPNVKKFLKEFKKHPEKLHPIMTCEETNYLEWSKNRDYSFMKTYRIQGKDYLDYAIELSNDFEKEKHKNGFSK